MKANLTTGEKLQDLRKERGLTIKQVCDMIQTKYNFTLSTGKLNEMENDKPKDHGFKSFVYLAKFYNVSVDYLLGLSDISSIPTDGKLQAAAEVTGLSDSALSALQEYTEDELTALSVLLENAHFQEVLYLIMIKTGAFTRYNVQRYFLENGFTEVHFAGSTAKTHVRTQVLIDSLLQTGFLNAVNEASIIIGGNENGKHNPTP